MTLRLPIAGPDLTPDQRAAIQSRRSGTTIVPVGDILEPHENDWVQWQDAGYMPWLLYQELIKLSLNGTDNPSSLSAACRKACLKDPSQFPETILRDVLLFSDQILRRLCLIWELPPHDHPDRVIYDANFQSFCGDSIYIEVMYRDFPPRL